ncbi:MAG: hypothetical protein AB7F79_00145 [Steroidobacteraceae bacterium]
MFKYMVLMLTLAGLTACSSLRVTGTEGLTAERLAHVSSDYRLRAGAPVNVYLRSVDGQALKFWQRAADIEAGSHRLLVDCAVSASQKLSRHVLDVSLEAGVRYYLLAEANDQRGCTRVSLEEAN